MASLTNVALMAQVPYEPAELPERGAQSVSTQVAAAQADMDRDPAQNIDVHNRLGVVERQGPTTGPDPWTPGTDRPAMARDVGELVPFNGEVHGLGTHVEFVAGADYQPGDANPAPPFAPRRNTYRLPPPPADNNLVLGE
jgi:hypothetical protein